VRKLPDPQKSRGETEVAAGAVAVARWVAGAIDRLDQAAPTETASAIMEACGANCAAVNDGAIARRQKYRSEEEFLAAELKKPMAGTRL
jgi:hypothetical protein